jgi:hypothetical protein
MSTVLLLSQLESLFQSLTSQILGTTDPSAVRVGWNQQGAPGWAIGSDVTFLLLNYSDNQITRQMETTYAESSSTDATASLTYQVVIRAEWTLYGPNSFDHADLIRSSLFQEPYKTTLAQSNLALITDIMMPVRAPELYNGQWWERSTFYAEFNELVTRTSSVPYIQTAPVTTESG